ncbi:NAD(P)H-hydrate dehydratase [Pararhodobacter sp. SW119]|uniref:NAD(P)H-hydrate dehydratase n=1 Tax=Pararhodobacter sp. SW119 TaxID=2780075 RepID=UPI001ADFD0DB|nr:NAD(P)H-hydrate dehydratase [Pararhodobacter sp. SW119]
MTELLSSAQMRAIEKAAIESQRVSGLDLMERAGQGVLSAILAEWPDMAAAPGSTVVFCGPGNNGGDGYVIARLLAVRGWTVAVHAASRASSGDAGRMRALWEAQGRTTPLEAFDPDTIAPGTLVVDALFGTGLGRPVACAFWGPLAAAQARGARLVAVDILSGLCADSGRVRTEGGFLDRPADLTVTFEALKLGHALAPGAVLSGPVRVVPIGIEPERTAYSRDHPAQVARRAQIDPAVAHKGLGHKYSHGHALVLSGGPGKGGAARLAARAALRIGAGLVTLGCPPAALIENAARLDAVMLAPLRDARALADFLSDPRIGTLCLGPGMGTHPRAEGLLAAALDARRGVVLDADALTLLARHEGLRAALHPGCVLTPHEGEFARLVPDLAAQLSADPADTAPVSKVDAARAAAHRFGCTVLLKGPDTVIAAPDGTCAVSTAFGPDAAPWLATAGAGDVLAGMIAGLLARGFAPFAAAETAACLHLACARRFGPGLIAEDLPEGLPAILRALG